MKVKLTAPFSCYYLGSKRTYAEGDIAEGWPAGRALARGVAVPYRERKKKEEADESQDHES